MQLANTLNSRIRKEKTLIVSLHRGFKTRHILEYENSMPKFTLQLVQLQTPKYISNHFVLICQSTMKHLNFGPQGALPCHLGSFNTFQRCLISVKLFTRSDSLWRGRRGSGLWTHSMIRARIHWHRRWHTSILSQGSISVIQWI